VYHDTMGRGEDGVLRFTDRDFELIVRTAADGTTRLHPPRRP